MYPRLISDVIERIRQSGGVVHTDPSTDLLTVNREFTASLILARCRRTDAGSLRWLIRVDAGLMPDITIAVRMDAENHDPLDYYLLPRLDLMFEKLLPAQDSPLGLDTFRFNNLDFFFGMAQRTKIWEAA
jgi:hypothetical protein